MSVTEREQAAQTRPGWWLPIKCAIWLFAVSVGVAVMTGTQSPAIRIVALALIVGVAATLHLAFRPQVAQTRASALARPRR